MVSVTSWGRLQDAEHDVRILNNRQDIATALREGAPGIAYGMGRSYGDVCLNPGGTLWRTTGLDHFIKFDEESGILVCEAGVVLRDIQHLVIPRGWSLPVTPGTQLITVGGAIANDVHGKNHHVHGTFGDHVRSLTLMRTDGAQIICGPHRLVCCHRRRHWSYWSNHRSRDPVATHSWALVRDRDSPILEP
jgi:hypothetical protein